jgi:hypothetical protein
LLTSFQTRRGGDSNPRRRDCRRNGFRDRRIQPLCHLSTNECIHSLPPLQLPPFLLLSRALPQTLNLSLSVKQIVGSSSVTLANSETYPAPRRKKPIPKNYSRRLVAEGRGRLPLYNCLKHDLKYQVYEIKRVGSHPTLAPWDPGSWGWAFLPLATRGGGASGAGVHILGRRAPVRKVVKPPMALSMIETSTTTPIGSRNGLELS